MKTQILITSFIFALAGILHASDYVISIDGRSAEIGINEELKFTTSAGKVLTIILKQKEFIVFKSSLFSMKHKNTIKPIKNNLGDGIYQTMMMTALGTGIIVQEYMHMNPEQLINLMIKELTKEEVDYGYKYNEKNIEKIIDDKKVRGKQALTTYPGAEWTRSVLAYGDKDKGVIIVTMIEKDQYNSEQYLISDFWKYFSLSID